MFFVVAIFVIDPWADESLAVHMTQHLLLMVVVAPLAAIAVSPLPAPAWARTTAFAFGAVAAQTIALGAWHSPALFDLAERHELVHVLEHVSFLATAFAVWWVILVPNTNLIVRFSVCVAAAAPMMLLGVLMTFATHPWYSAYSAGGGLLAPLTDQQTAGSLMWGPSGVPYVIAAAWLVASAVHADELARTAG